MTTEDQTSEVEGGLDRRVGKDELGVFQPGHTYSLKYGYTSSRAISPLAEAIARVALDQAPALRAHPILVDLFAAEYAVVLLLRKTLDERGVTDHNGDPRESHLRRMTTHTTSALKLLREMGLTRKVAAELQLDIAQAAAAAMSTAERAERVPEPVRAFLAGRGFAGVEDGAS